jgi:ABC-2 type transport system ATP-binding protein
LIRPTAGSGTIFGQDILKDSVEIRSRIGYLPQDPRFYEFMSARETLTFVAGFYFKGPKKLVIERVNETLELVGLADKADRPIKGFSGGERQRLGIAQAQVNYPDLLILDEPAASLDPLGRHDVLEVLEKLRKHTTVFYSTHILDDVQQISDTVAILNRGELAAYGSIETLLAGGAGVVYQVAMKGDAAGAEQRAAAQPWVSKIQSREANGVTHWVVGVEDEQRAELHLLRLLLEDENLVVTDFGRQQFELEDVFMQIVQGGNHAR